MRANDTDTEDVPGRVEDIILTVGYWMFMAGRGLLGTVLLLLACAFTYWAVTGEWKLLMAAALCVYGGLSVLRGRDILN